MRVRRIVAALVMTLCAWSGMSTTVLAADETPIGSPIVRPDLPPVEDFFRRAQYSDVTLSPDGKLIAALVPLNGHRNLALVDFGKGTASALTSLTDTDVASYRWISDQLLEIKTANLADAGGLVFLKQDVLIDTSGNVVRNMGSVLAGAVPRDQARFVYRGIAEILMATDRAGDQLIVEAHERNYQSLDAYLYNPHTNSKQLLTFYSPGDVDSYVPDKKGQVRIAISHTRDGKRRIVSYRRTNDDKWTTLRDEPVEGVTITPVGFDFDDRTLFVRSPNPDNGGRRDIFKFDPETNQLGERVFESKGFDAGAVVFDWVGKRAVGIGDRSRDGIDWIDPEWSRLQKSVDMALPKTSNRITWARFDPSKMIVRTEAPDQAPVYYLLNHTTLKMEEIAASFPWIKEMSPRRFVRYQARDGLSIPAWLTMPNKPDGKKPPLIVDIHGGPFVGATASGYNADAEFFASRGYATLQPDFRGTGGYGQAFEQKGWKQWGLAMQDDITDGVKWLIDTGKVDPDRVCLFGGSYGGYATLWGLEKEPSMFRCGVAIVAVSDLEMLFDVSWSDTMRSDSDGAMTNFFKRTLGDPDTDRAKLREVSPLYHADRIQAPLLLAYGGSDVRVPLIHASRMRSALDKFNKPYEYVVYDNEGHGFNKDENRFDFYRRVDAFLKKSLAPRTSPTAQSSQVASPAATQ